MAPSLPPLTLYPNRKKWVYVAAVSAIIAAVGVMGILTGDTVERIFGWVFAVFFGFGLIAGAINLLPNASYLRIDTTGFVARSAFRTISLSWSEVSAFSAAAIPGADVPDIGQSPISAPPVRFVVFNFAEGTQKHSTGSRWSAKLSGFEGALPDTYGMSADELAAVMNRYRSGAVP